MGVGEPHPFRREPIDMGRGDLASFGVVTPHVSVSKVVGKYKYDVWYTRNIGRYAVFSRMD